MTTPVYLVTASVVAYLVGGIPFGYIIGRLVAGIDIRSRGSGNIGATNVGRVLGMKWGVAVLVPDALKGLLPVLAVKLTMREWLGLTEGQAALVVHAQVLVGLVAILGHMYPCWIGLRGGKGVATALGVAAILGPVATLVSVPVYVLTLLASRLPSLSSLLGALVFAVSQCVVMAREETLQQFWGLTAFSLAVPLLIIYRHRGNIRRILRGEEPRIGGRPAADEPGDLQAIDPELE